VTDLALGGFARMFERDDGPAVAAAFADAGLTQVQLNLAAIGLPTVPPAGTVDDAQLALVTEPFRRAPLRLWGLSATYNMAHPDPARRARETRNAAALIGATTRAAPVAVSLCSGTRDPVDMWAGHPGNGDERTWRDFRASLDVLLEAAAATGVLLAIEPEVSNVVSGTDAALRLVRELGPDASGIGFIMDPANLDPGQHGFAEVLGRAFESLSGRLICVHAKDAVPWSDTVSGSGVVDFTLVAALRAEFAPDVPVIIQDALEDEIPAAVDHVRRAFGLDR
jgi:sugar phosphate isomerase/epimerase